MQLHWLIKFCVVWLTKHFIAFTTRTTKKPQIDFSAHTDPNLHLKVIFLWSARHVAIFTIIRILWAPAILTVIIGNAFSENRIFNLIKCTGISLCLQNIAMNNWRSIRTMSLIDAEFCLCTGWVPVKQYFSPVDMFPQNFHGFLPMAAIHLKIFIGLLLTDYF